MTTKENALELYNKMGSDSKKESYAAEQKLCNILTGIINKLDTIEETVGHHIQYYPDEIFEVEYYCPQNELPCELHCNGYDDFYFDTEWLDWIDADFQKYFDDLRKRRMECISINIVNVENELNKHKRELERVTELTFENINFDIQ